MYVVPELRHFFVENLNSGTFLFLHELAALLPRITVPWRFQRLPGMGMKRHFMESECGTWGRLLAYFTSSGARFTTHTDETGATEQSDQQGLSDCFTALIMLCFCQKDVWPDSFVL